MKIIPQGKQEWWRFLVLPFKAYVVIAPLLVLWSAQAPRPRHSGVTIIEILIILSLFPCALVLSLAAGVFAYTGRKGLALPCAGFGVVALFIGCVLMST